MALLLRRLRTDQRFNRSANFVLGVRANFQAAESALIVT